MLLELLFVPLSWFLPHAACSTTVRYGQWETWAGGQDDQHAEASNGNGSSNGSGASNGNGASAGRRIVAMGWKSAKNGHGAQMELITPTAQQYSQRLPDVRGCCLLGCGGGDRATRALHAAQRGAL
jgi:hypothetical protein